MYYLMEKPKYIVYNNNDEPIALFFDAIAATNYIYTINGTYVESIVDEDINVLYTDFITDIEKMRDLFKVSKEEFLLSYSYLEEKEYDLTVEKIRDMTAEELERIKEQCKVLPDYD